MNTTTTTQSPAAIIAEFNKLLIAPTAPRHAMQDNLAARAPRMAELLATHGLEIRKGSYARNPNNGEARIYLLPQGARSQDAKHVWRFVTMSGGYFRKIAPSRVHECINEIADHLETLTTETP